MKDLYLVGLGIRFAEHLTTEARSVLERCRIVLHVDENHRGLKRFNERVVNLGRLYWTGDDRALVYARICQRVVKEMGRGPGVTLVTYGHPLLFDDVMHDLLRYCRRHRRSVRVVPGVSCLDTLAIDLGLDYGDGVQIYDSTDLVLNQHKLNPHIHTLLLQLAEYNFVRTSDALDRAKPRRYGSLVNYLRRFYPASHRVFVVYSNDGKVGQRFCVRLSDLDKHRMRMFPGTTLYVPPAW
jgi:precorrin-2 methylase